MGNLVLKEYKSEHNNVESQHFGLLYLDNNQEYFITPVYEVIKIETSHINEKLIPPIIQCKLKESGNLLVAEISTPELKWENPYKKLIDLTLDEYFVSDDKGKTWKNKGHHYKNGYDFAIYHDSPSLWDPEFYGNAFIYNGEEWIFCDRNWWSEGSSDISWAEFESRFPGIFEEYLVFKTNYKNRFRK